MSQTRQLRFVKKTKQPTSIIIPIYNAEKYLRECLDSLLAQTTREWDAVLVDDGSTDSSPAICDEYAAKDNRFSVIHKANAGQAAARNSGLSVATGLYITFLDADDMLHPMFVEQMAKMLKDTNADIAECTLFNSRRCKWPKSARWNVDLYKAEDAIAQILYQERLSSSMCAKMYRAGLFEGIQFHEGLYYEDLELIIRLLDETKAKVVSTRQCLYFYRYNQDSFINTLTEKRFDVRKVVDMIEERFAADEFLIKAAEDRKFAANCNMFLLTWRLPIYSEISRDCLRVMRAYRWRILKNSRSRLKNKFGALLSYFLFNRFISANKTDTKPQAAGGASLPQPDGGATSQQAPS